MIPAKKLFSSDTDLLKPLCTRIVAFFQYREKKEINKIPNLKLQVAKSWRQCWEFVSDEVEKIAGPFPSWALA